MGAVDILAGPITGASDLDEQDFTRLWGASEGDRAGAAVADLGDIDGDGNEDLIVGAPGVESSSGGMGEMGGASGPEGAGYVVYGPVEPGSTVMLEDSRHVAILSGGESAGRLGMAVAGIGDITGDGLPDFAVGSPYTGSGGRWSNQPVQAGTVYLLSDLPDDEQEIGDVAFASLEGEEEYGWLGTTVAGGKDLNGDGTPDLVVGAPTDRVGAMDVGDHLRFEVGCDDVDIDRAGLTEPPRTSDGLVVGLVGVAESDEHHAVGVLEVHPEAGD